MALLREKVDVLLDRAERYIRTGRPEAAIAVLDEIRDALRPAFETTYGTEFAPKEGEA